jgi:hypothetical protein
MRWKPAVSAGLVDAHHQQVDWSAEAGTAVKTPNAGVTLE